MTVHKIIHIDMDAFYASVEQYDNPELIGKPVAVGGSRERGVVAAASYEARKFGVRSAMPSSRAYQLCPKIVFVKPRFERYKEISSQIREIFHEYTDLIEPLSLDEAYLDVTDSQACKGSATLIAQQIRADIYNATGLTASAGVAPVKFIAKIASDENKPNGQFVVLPDEVDPFLEQLPLGKIPGVGKVTLERLNLKGLYTGKDVREKGVNWMQQHVGNFGVSLYQKCAGEYIGSVSTERIRKSLSVEHTYEYNKTSLQECLDQIPSLIDELTRRLDKQQLQNRINKLSVKVKFANFVVTSADQAYHQLNTEIFVQLLTKAYQRGLQQPVRLLGIGVGIKSQPEHNLQLSILD